MEQTLQLIRIIEGAIFAADGPLSIDDILALFAEEDKPERAAVKDALEQLQQDYQGRGITLKEIASGYEFQVCPDLSQWVGRLWEERAPRFSRALMETLALVAYRQPITRGEIEEIRGVAVSTNIMRTLVERDWVRVVGFREVPGRPALYATTKEFLDYFGLKRLQDLPPLADIVDLDVIAEKIEQQQSEAEAPEEEQLAEQPQLSATSDDKEAQEENQSLDEESVAEV